MPTGAFTQDGAELVLNLLRGVGTAPAALYLGLSETPVAADDTLGTIDELTVTGYARQLVAFDAPTGLDPVAMATAAGEVFGPLTGDAPATQYGFLTDDPSGTSGIIIYRWSDDVAEDAEVGESLAVPTGACVVAIDTTEAAL